MQTRRTHASRHTRPFIGLLIAVLISLPNATLAQDDAGEIESFDEDGIEAPSSTSLGTLEDYRWAPSGLGRMLDTLIVRPAALALTGLSAVTFSVAVIMPAIRGDREGISEMYQGMIVEPIKYAVLRPPFSAPDHFVLLQEKREAEETLAQEAAEIAAKEAEEARAKASGEMPSE